jgi:hypothetical protein
MFSIIFLILPQLYFVHLKRDNLQAKSIAMQLLNERLFQFADQTDTNLEEYITYQNRSFYLKIMQVGANSNYYSGCLSWVSHNDQSENICGSIIK